MASHTINMIARHIQNMSAAATLEPHWGYVDRALPCTNDAGSCAYLDTVYDSHDLGILYTFILWAAIGSILFVWCISRRFLPSRTVSTAHDELQNGPAQSSAYSLSRSISSAARRYLLPEMSILRPIFGRMTRLQLLLLTALTGYLAVFTFVGLVYKTWITPVKKMPDVYNTRTGLGPFADRVGVLAYALTPLSILLSSRESVLSLLTGLPYQSFNFLHRWLGYIIYAQSVLHTVGWVVVEGKLYQPQPTEWDALIAQKYIIWGVVAMVLLSIIFFSSLSCAVRLTGYETWRKMHYVMAMLYVGACWGHWTHLACWMIASLTVWLVDRGIRFTRTALLHYQYKDRRNTMGFRSIAAECMIFEDDYNGDVVRINFEHNHAAWRVGQHFYLTFADGGIWQSHPFTPASLPSIDGFQKHLYVIRAKAGETRRIAQLVKSRINAKNGKMTTPVVLSGPYGTATFSERQRASDINVLCVAGGTGITFVLPVLTKLLGPSGICQCNRKIELVWAVRRRSDIQWVQPELDILHAACKKGKLNVRIFVTRDGANQMIGRRDSPISKDSQEKIGFVKVQEDKVSASSPSESSDEICCAPRQSSFSVQQATHTAVLLPETRHPDLAALVHDFVESTIRGSTSVFASGPAGMISDLRETVAACNSSSKVLRGEERFDVHLINDDRLEW